MTEAISASPIHRAEENQIFSIPNLLCARCGQAYAQQSSLDTADPRTPN
jgi:hypothetical protein